MTINFLHGSSNEAGQEMLRKTNDPEVDLVNFQ